MIARSIYHMPHSLRSLTPDPTPKFSPPTQSLDLKSIKRRAMGSRPLSLHIPAGSFPPARPTLDEVLSNTAPYPYTLSAFMAYLSQNHCLETLEFTMEAKRYRDSYRSVARMLGQSMVPADAPQTQQLITLWRRLISAYIAPGAPREINLSSAARDPLLANANPMMAPPPELLDPAVRIMHDLMEESIFIHFVNSQTFGPQIPSKMESPYIEDRPHRLRRAASRSQRSSPGVSRDDSTYHHRMSSSARVAALVKTGSHLSGYSSSGDSGSPVFTDDSLSSSPTGIDPMTPPTTPPGSAHNYSPRNRSDTTWKKMGAKLGFKKRPGSSSRDGRWEE
ncbi:regulator of G protein signaling domain protein RgsD [Talaromyces stipitatus ATCC 10500]|uniref:Regulator of G protein signaling domain protein RgsD n=1 Tax=Talaromyces stipitatus (strain ATCC 10500 / CBS 375.48 / QM 6759 / NRRL 1006) TaxID=441959 RepID=B8LTY5_TALSN|nr:regulator of G protein signaling domain protein RgsD [Talaromyces stipitatus ATCC 10500]XP_002341203.1 regulator of G protein signaling domain protein RgsD [Talaromyces stipitatus ATCC 10500]XP_002341204.1 regulator of G protein signaling domain protein RgsD [Talaromyces stipitatus ATCC 10500]EED23815.1 regulator of G protein signaling domain protein RgsD [Talaromyces stipitatus ATCC 10500]EED23816.1 regulator of G protein signaling domain protein RgsD [Talaromyces stipitatus ATCC 10500]EED